MKGKTIFRGIIPAVLLINSFVFSQESTGVIFGTVKDAVSMEPVIGANILVIDTKFGDATNTDGEFRIAGLNPGTYSIRISSVGYKTVVKTDLVVSLSKPLRLDVETTEVLVKLSDVTVTTDYFSQEPTDLISTASFNNEEIRRAPGGFEDVVRALSILPGVAQADAGRNDLIVRGGGPSENLYLLDGFPIPNINHFGNQGTAGGPISYINLDFVRSTTFSTGGFPVLYGDKLSSVLSIDLKKGRSDRLGGKATISATQFGLNLEGPIAENSNFIFSVRRSYLDLIFKAAGFAFVPEYYDILSKADFKWDNNNSFSFLFLGALDKVNFFNDTPEKRYDNSRTFGGDQTQYTSYIKYQHIFKNGFVDFILGRNSVKFQNGQRDTLGNPIYLNNSHEVENSLKSELIYKISTSSEINAGADFKYIDFNSQVLFPGFVTSFGDTLPINNYDYIKNYVKWGAYLNYNSMMIDNFTANLGVRADYFSAIDKKYYFSPRLSTSYNLDPISSFNFSTGIYYQSPSYIWLNGGMNDGLRDIEVKQYVLGYERMLREDIQLKAEVFQKNYSNYPASTLRPYLILANTGAGFSDDNFSSFALEPLVSKGKGISRGMELSIRKKLSDMPFYGIFSLTLSKAEFTPLDGLEKPGKYDQRVILNLSGGHKINAWWEASMKFRYSSGSPYTPFRAQGKQYSSEYNSLRLPANHSLDLRVDKRWNFSTWTLITYVDIQNVYNRKNITAVRWDPAKNYVDDSSSIGLLPSIGISAEF